MWQKSGTELLLGDMPNINTAGIRNDDALAIAGSMPDTAIEDEASAAAFSIQCNSVINSVLMIKFGLHASVLETQIGRLYQVIPLALSLQAPLARQELCDEVPVESLQEALSQQLVRCFSENRNLCP